MMPAQAVRIGPGVVRRTSRGSVAGVWCRCPACDRQNFISLGEQHAHLGASGLSLTPGFHCECDKHVELRNGRWVVTP